MGDGRPRARNQWARGKAFERGDGMGNQVEG